LPAGGGLSTFTGAAPPLDGAGVAAQATSDAPRTIHKRLMAGACCTSNEMTSGGTTSGKTLSSEPMTMQNNQLWPKPDVARRKGDRSLKRAGREPRYIFAGERSKVGVADPNKIRLSTSYI
jgi:hypothetical protein